MRKLLHLSHPFMLQSPSPSPSPSPYTSPETSLSDLHDSFFFPEIPVVKSIFDLTTISFIASLILISLLAFSLITLLHIKSRRLHHLQNFNSLWTVRLLLVSLVFLWALNEILRLPFVRRKYLYPFLPALTLEQQAEICKIHVVLSLGFLEPGFLVTLLFLVNVSIKQRNPRRTWALVSVFTTCCPILLLQIIFVYFSSFDWELPKFMHGSSINAIDEAGNRTVLCVYPFFSCIIFGGFVVAYAMAFVLSCWRVMSLVINKTIRRRINMLAITIMVALPVQMICLTMSWLWLPEDAQYGGVVLVMFLCVTLCMAVGEFILVLKPIMDALAAGGDGYRYSSDVLRQWSNAGDRGHDPGL